MATTKRTLTAAAEPRVAIPGSERPPLPNTTKLPARSSRTRLTVSVILHPRTPLFVGPAKVTRLTRAQFRAQYGPDPSALKALRAFAKQFDLTLVDTPDSLARRTVQLTGTRASLEQAFGATLSTIQQGEQTFRVREGSLSLPASIAPFVQAVLGLDDRPQAKPHFRVSSVAASPGKHVVAHAANASFTPPQLAALYQFPANASAAGQTIAILELGGGYRTADITAYFKSLGLTPPSVTAVSVDGGKNSPSTASSADGEVMLDIEVAASVAPGAKVVVYFAPNTDQGFIDAVTTAVHDSTNKPSVLSISWGGPESTWTGQASTALDSACQAAALLGVTITVACGDSGSDDGVGDGANHVDFPASSPHVLACGGTKLTADGTTIATEVVWNETASNEGATGGGVSTLFPLPTWQANANVPAAPTAAGGRGVPDVAADADPVTGYSVRVDGQTLVIGGTSAVAPLWAGLIALANAQNKSAAGFINPALYAASTAFRDITSGNNGSFSAGPGWDPCTGLGSPIGTAIVTTVAGGSTSGGGSTTSPPHHKRKPKPPASKPTRRGGSR